MDLRYGFFRLRTAELQRNITTLFKNHLEVNKKATGNALPADIFHPNF